MLDPGLERAAAEYEALRTRLLRFFVWRECLAPEECVDLTFERVSRRLEQGQAMWAEDPRSYVFGVARNVVREVRAGRLPGTRHEALADHPEPAAGLPDESAQERERELAALDECLAQLPPQNRTLLLGYYTGAQGEKIAARQALALRLGASVGALRLRVHRLRRQVEQCLREKLGAVK